MIKTKQKHDTVTIFATIGIVLMAAFMVFLNFRGENILAQQRQVNAAFTQTANAPTPTPTPKTAVVKTRVAVDSTSSKINCNGPDGKTFQATQEECTNFNKAWGKGTATNTSKGNTSSYGCTIDGKFYKVKDSNECVSWTNAYWYAKADSAAIQAWANTIQPLPTFAPFVVATFAPMPSIAPIVVKPYPTIGVSPTCQPHAVILNGNIGTVCLQ